MRRPSFQFYPGDWQANSNLRRCTHEEKGVWLDIMCLLHDQEEYGIARWTLKELAQAVGTQISKVRALVAKGILKGADGGESCEPFIYIPRSGRKNGDPVTLVPVQDGPIWYSSRMVRDEYVRNHAGASTRFASGETGDKDPRKKSSCGEQIPGTLPDDLTSPKQSLHPSPSLRQGEDQSDGSSSSSSSSVNHSEANASGGEPPKVTDPNEIIFGYGVPLLTNAGTPEKQARSFLGGLRKQHGDQALIDALRNCLKERPLQPLEWIAAALPPKGYTKQSRHTGFDKIDYRAGVASDGRF